MESKFKAMVLSCMDPRFQNLVHNHLKKKKLTGKYSAFTIAGGAIGVTNQKFKKWHKTFYENLNTSVKLHKINKLIVINHQDCGAAKIVKKKNKTEEELHRDSFLVIKKKISKRFPTMKIEFYVINLLKKIKKYKI